MTTYASLTDRQKREAQERALRDTLDEVSRYVTNPALTPPAAAKATVDAVRARAMNVAQGRDYLAPATMGDESTVWLNTADDQEAADQEATE